MKNLVCIIPVSSFEFAKTRLSPFLSEDERENLLKYMLKDIIHAVSSEISDIVLVSKDKKIKDFAINNKVSFVKEKHHEDDFLNNAISDAIKEVKINYPEKDFLILPSDIPLIKREHIQSVKNMPHDLLISPSRGGGTNLLCFNNSFNFKTSFGEMSYFKHIKTANSLGMSINLLESFFVSLDVNTPQDLGEILLHGAKTLTYEYLSSLNIVVYDNHGEERLKIERKNE